ncbi:MAG TPA: hydrogenase expression/formation protein HypE [Methylomusa anaerophila]|uniref:hydrogenase expression/formation protein HypE n=1 Tax=Methylomusa anaerophila TaxID=1930071 RepID=UPI000F8213DE|nr:hydrogenase expression/formation protein HypE [Methylomusa anaerophila]HML88499.1 hydrogenase expression/formation protein HypE [Methylomusa anaerophila]
MGDRILLAHGSGGKLSHELVTGVMAPVFDNSILAEMHDGAFLNIKGVQLAFTTDSYVVKPRFFPGGDIGKLAVCGTVNDLAVSGAEPLYLSAGFVLEEGLALAELERIVASMGLAAAEAGVQIVTGDTKVVERGAIDGIYINTAGIGAVFPGVHISAGRVKPGQDVIVSGCLGDHAIAVMSERHGLTLPAPVVSDCAPLAGMVKDILKIAPQVPMLRDPTRGGLATALNEIALQTGMGILLEETAIPVRPEIKAVCDILGFDPLYLANEGKVIVLVEKQDTEKVLAAMKSHPYGLHSCVIGAVTARPAGQVGIKTAIGGTRMLDMLTGEQLPRIC